MIKEANVKIDGLTVIAGENDTGKSTVGKALYLQLKSMEDILDGELVEDIFDDNMTQKGSISLIYDGYVWRNSFEDNMFSDDIEVFLYNNKKKLSEKMINKKNPKLDSIVVETPLVWNFMKLFNQLPLIESQVKILIKTPRLMKDLHFKLSFSNKKKGILLNRKITSIIDGQFQQDEKGDFFFNKNDNRIELINTATGIKYFGIFQILSENNHLNENTVLVLDEPEVHLHPKWQLEMAKIIVELVKNGVKIVVNSHSPYMLEALKRYSELQEIEEKTNFYLAEDGYIEQQDSLENIFEKLALPMRELKELKMAKYLK